MEKFNFKNETRNNIHMEEHAKGLGEYWTESQELFSKIYKTGVRKYLETLPILSEGFRLEDHSVRCIDEGTPGGIHVAGSGILLSASDKKEQLEQLVEELVGAGADGVYSHEGCGAAKLYAETVMGNLDGAKDYAVEWAKKLALRLDAPYKGHITDLARPKEFHNARIAYYDGSGKFDPFKIKEIPDGFIISRYYLDSEYAREELKIALSIAFGHHGFGDKFTKDNPFIIVPIEKFVTKRKDISLSDLEREAREISAVYGDRVIVEGIREPLQE